ncbi:MAG: hypothetical protein ACOCUU_02105 [Nanoarchaeota archaeon]
MKSKFIESNKAQFNLSFAWLFSIIIGGIILFFAIYIASQIISSGERETDAKLGQEIGVLLNPLETSFQSLQVVPMTLPKETRIYTSCENSGNFGLQLISVSQKSFKKWSEPEIQSVFANKYLISKNPSQGEKFYLFSKPFKFPFKVGNLIYLISAEKEYCFVNSPDSVQQELESLEAKNIKYENCSLSENPKEQIDICFDLNSGNCEVFVDYSSGYIEKNNSRVYFTDNSLMFAGIFSPKENYECQVKRLMKRTASLAQLYISKEDIVSRKGCNSNLDIDLSRLGNQALNLEDSRELLNLYESVEELEIKNKNLECRLW